MPDAGEVKVGTVIMGMAVTEVGEEMSFGRDNYLLPVKCEDSVYVIVAWSGGEHPTAPRIWRPDLETAAWVIAESVRMPRVERGLGSDVIHVTGADPRGDFLVKMFFNEKKMRGYKDELHRP